MKIKSRMLQLDLPGKQSAFLWGPRQTGKSYWLKAHYPEQITLDFLKTTTFADYISHPALLRERFSDTNKMIILDEVQKVPSILDEVHWLIENKNIQFILTGSSPRKLRRSHANRLGGRAWRYTMTPLCTPEIENLNIEHAMYTGFLPPHITLDDPKPALRSYVADYLKEEIATEALVQNIPSFAEFLHVAALTNGELLNYSNVARESGVKTNIVRNYFQILEDTLLGFRLQPWQKTQTRRLIETEKFYFFDVGIANYLARRRPQLGSKEFGKAFEHFILMELKAYQAYKDPELLLHYWRSASGQEVDFILGNMEVAIEIKTSQRTHIMDTKNLKILKDEYQAKQCYLVSFEENEKQFENGIICLPWQRFLEKLWQGELVTISH